MEDKKYCPLTGQDCKEYAYVWWYIPPKWGRNVTIPGKCAVLDIAQSLDVMCREP